MTSSAEPLRPVRLRERTARNEPRFQAAVRELKFPE
jgi:hypothetical protein